MMQEENHKRSKQNSRDVEQYQVQINVLKEENMQIQKLMEK